MGAQAQLPPGVEGGCSSRGVGGHKCLGSDPSSAASCRRACSGSLTRLCLKSHICTTETAPVAQVGEFWVRPQGAWVAKLTQQRRVLAQVGQSGPCLDAAWGPREGEAAVRTLVSAHQCSSTLAISVCYPAWLLLRSWGCAHPFFCEERHACMAKALEASLWNDFALHLPVFLLSSLQRRWVSLRR